MPRAILNQFDGGQCEDVRTFATNENETLVNFDILTNPHLLSPYIGMTAETVSSGVITDFKITDVDSIIVSNVPYFVALGEQNSGSAAPHFFKKDSSSNIAAVWQAGGVGVNNKVKNTLVVYKELAHCLGSTGSAHNLQRYDGVTTVSTRGTLGGFGDSPAKPFVHPEDNVLYMVSGNIISKDDGTTFTATAFTLPSDKVGVSLTSYGTYLVIVCRPKSGVGNSVAYLWGRDTTLTTVQAVIDLGAGQVNIVENLFNNLFFVMSSMPVGGYGNVTQNKLTVKAYGGGAVEIIKEISLPSSLGTALNNIKQKVGNTLFFGFSNDTAIFSFGKNKKGSYYLSHTRGLPSGTTTLHGFSIIGDAFWVAYDTAGGSNLFARSMSLAESQTYPESTYTTTINPGMPIEDRYRLKEFDALSFSFVGGTSNVLQVSLDGGAYFDVISNALTGMQTIPCFAKDEGTNFENFYEIQFKMKSTGNMKPRELRYRYNIVNTDDI